MIMTLLLPPLSIPLHFKSCLRNSSKVLQLDNNIPGPFYYCLTQKIERCEEQQKRLLPKAPNFGFERCIVRSFESCMTRLPIRADKAYRAAEMCLHSCLKSAKKKGHIFSTKKKGHSFPICLFECFQKRIKLH
jgi:hypothetical protein